MKVCVVGSGSWGTALALSLCAAHDTTLWSHNPQKAEQMRKDRINPALADIKFLPQLNITSDPSCVRDQDMVVIASPSFAIRSVCETVAPYLSQQTTMVCVTKGIENGTLLRMSQIVEEITGHCVVSLTGPSHAEEVARGIPTGCLAACPNKELAEQVQDVFMTDTFRIYTSPDIVGAELGGAMKNVIALCAGVCDGLGYGDNTKAMLMTRGLTEIARLGVAMGANKETFAGLAGIGDLIVTCTSMHSRNRRAGILIGQGNSPEEAMKKVGAVVEGYYASQSALELANSIGVEMPIIHGAYEVLYNQADASQVVRNLLMRSKKPESEDAGWL